MDTVDLIFNVLLVFQVSLAIMSVAMFMMGCEMNYTIGELFSLSRSKAVLLPLVLAYLRRPLAPGLGMVCQYLVMPFMAYVIGLLLLTDQVRQTPLSQVLVAFHAISVVFAWLPVIFALSP